MLIQLADPIVQAVDVSDPVVCVSVLPPQILRKRWYCCLVPFTHPARVMLDDVLTGWYPTGVDPSDMRPFYDPCNTYDHILARSTHVFASMTQHSCFRGSYVHDEAWVTVLLSINRGCMTN